jgi:hypothetical protein
MIYALVSAGASALASALGASEAGSAAGASAEGSASEEVQRVCSVLVREVASSTFCTYQVVPQELHDQSGVLVALLRKGVELSDGIVESLLGKLASLVGRVEDLVVEDGEVQGETETDGVGRSKVLSSDLGGGLVSLEGLVGGGLALVANGELGKVAVVVTLPISRMWLADCQSRCAACIHLVVEDLGLAALSRGDKVAVKALEDVLADLGKLGLDLLAVLLDKSDLSLVALRLLLLLDRGDDSP